MSSAEAEELFFSGSFDEARKLGGEKIVSVEDPVEYELPGVAQVPVHARLGLTFARALRSILRQDPDVLLVGEMRDPETAEICIQAALTGHLVLSTLHTNDAPGALTRLVDLGVPDYLVASTVQGVLAQRLVRRVCAACAESVAPEPGARRGSMRPGRARSFVPSASVMKLRISATYIRPLPSNAVTTGSLMMGSLKTSSRR